MSDKSYLDWPFFEERHRKLARELDAWAAANLGDPHESDVDAACRTLVAQARGGRLAAPRDRRHRLWRRFRPDRHTCDLPHPRDAGAPFRPRRFRLRHAGPGLGRDHPLRHGGAETRLSAARRIGRGDRRVRPLRAGRRIGRGGAATAPPARTATPMCSTARRPGSPTAASPISTSCSRAPARASGSRGISAFIVDAGAPGFTIAERIDVIAPHPLARLKFTNCRIPKSRLLGAAGEGFKIAMRNARRLPHVGGGGGAWLRPPRARRGAQARDHARRCSADARRFPAHAGEARADGDRRRCCRAAHLPRRLAARPGQDRHARGGDGEDDRNRGGAARHRCGGADVRRTGSSSAGSRSSGSIARSARCASTRARPRCSN